MSQPQHQIAPNLPYHPSGDQRFAQLDQTMAHYHHEPTALIQVLHAAQHNFGYLAPDVLRYIATAMKLPLAHVYGVTTFYNFFSIVPRGKYQIMEGTDRFHRFVVIEFPTLEQAVKCNQSKEYQEAAAFRRAPGVGEVEQVMVDGGDATT